jgi:transposase InsO family protein
MASGASRCGLAVVREFLCPEVSRSGLDRCLFRHGVGNLRDLPPKETKAPRKTFKAYEPCSLHLDVKYLPQMEDEARRRYLFVAIDRATRWAYLEVKEDKTAKSASAFLQNLSLACPIRIQKILTDNGKEFTDRLLCRDKQASGQHEFDQLCAALDIEHRLTRPRTPQANGMERKVWALQWPHCGHPEAPSFHERRRLGTNPAPLSPALQRTPAPVRPQQQNPSGRHEHVVRFPPSTLPPSA